VPGTALSRCSNLVVRAYRFGSEVIFPQWLDGVTPITVHGMSVAPSVNEVSAWHILGWIEIAKVADGNIPWRQIFDRIESEEG
jgi:hypothetical protein